MKNSILMGALVLTMALVPSFASATSTPYDVPGTMTVPKVVEGVESLEPDLDEEHGTARILNPTFAAGYWSFNLECYSVVACDGFIIS